MIVNEHLAALGEPGERQHAPDVAARDHSRGLQHAVFANAADEAHFPPLGKANGSFDRNGNFSGEAVGGHGGIYRRKTANTAIRE
jgi:hypothetical protein